MLRHSSMPTLAIAAFAGCGILPYAGTALADQNPIGAETQHLLPSDGAAGDVFGFRVAIDGDTLIAGASGHDTAPGPIGGEGAAYIFVRSGARGDEVWTQQAKLTASDGEPLDQFGISVAIDGDVAVVGAYMPAGANTGAAYVFRRTGEPGSEVWAEEDILTPNDGAPFDYFGSSVAVEAETIVVGSTRADTAGGTDAGAAYVYKLAGNHWNQSAKLTASNGNISDAFGNSLAISGDTIVVGAYLRNTPFTNSGSVYVYVQNGGQWIEQAYLPMPDPTLLDEFGWSIAIDGDTLFIAAPFHPFPDEHGAVYVFQREGTIWTQQDKLLASDGQPHDLFGSSVALHGETAVVGARWHDAGAGPKSGAAYVLSQLEGTWIEQAKLAASDGEADDSFGESAALEGNTVLVGAAFDDTPDGTDAGSVYVFDLDSTSVPGDIDGNGIVNLDDYALLLACFNGPAFDGTPECACADLNGDTTVDLRDFAELQASFTDP